MSTTTNTIDASPSAGLQRPRLRQIGVREFRDRASQLMASGDILAIERHGHTIGYFIPAKSAASEQARLAQARFEQAIAEAKASGLFDEGMLSDPLTAEESPSDAASRRHEHHSR
jgi:hypothetical protein